MRSSSDARILEFPAFDKAAPSRRAAREHRMADDRREPSFRRGIWTNYLLSRRASPVALLERITRVRSMPWTPRAAAAARRSSANRSLTSQ